GTAGDTGAHRGARSGPRQPACTGQEPGTCHRRAGARGGTAGSRGSATETGRPGGEGRAVYDDLCQTPGIGGRSGGAGGRQSPDPVTPAAGAGQSGGEIPAGIGD